jgi:hypothetical protein
MRYGLFTESIVEVVVSALIAAHKAYVPGVHEQVAWCNLDLAMEQMCVRLQG